MLELPGRVHFAFVFPFLGPSKTLRVYSLGVEFEGLRISGFRVQVSCFGVGFQGSGVLGFKTFSSHAVRLTLQELVENGELNTVPEAFRITEDDLVNFDSMSDKFGSSSDRHGGHGRRPPPCCNSRPDQDGV